MFVVLLFAADGKELNFDLVVRYNSAGALIAAIETLDGRRLVAPSQDRQCSCGFASSYAVLASFYVVLACPALRVRLLHCVSSVAILTVLDSGCLCCVRVPCMARPGEFATDIHVEVDRSGFLSDESISARIHAAELAIRHAKEEERQAKAEKKEEERQAKAQKKEEERQAKAQKKADEEAAIERQASQTKIITEE